MRQALILWLISISFCAALIYGPVVPKPSQAGDVVAFMLQNPGGSPLASRYITFGHAFYPGQLRVNRNTSLNAYAVNSPSTTFKVQFNVKAVHSDGSVRHAILTFLQPALAANQILPVMLTSTQSAMSANLAIATAFPTSSASVQIKLISGPVFNFDVSREVRSAGVQDVWLTGDLATQIRVSKYVYNTLRVIFDATIFKDNSWCVDVQWFNDIMFGNTSVANGGGVATYTTSVTASGTTTSFGTDAAPLQNWPFQGFHREFCSKGVQSVNVQFDILNMIQAGAMVPYNYTNAVDDSRVDDLRNQMAESWYGKPFSSNGITQYMPTTGDRADIGPLPAAAAIWAVTQNDVARRYVLGLGDGSASVPWNTYDNKTARFVNIDDRPFFWFDGRGSVKPDFWWAEDSQTGWTADSAHTPCLSVVPYLITGSRFYYDRMIVQAHYQIISIWPDPRAWWSSQDQGLVVISNQMRGAAWGLRDINWGSFLGVEGSFDQTYFTKIVNNNFNALLNNLDASWQSKTGEAYGWFVGIWEGDAPSYKYWMHDYWSSVIGLMAIQGNAQAKAQMLWERNWMIDSVYQGSNFKRNNRAAYDLYSFDNATARTYCKTWKCWQTNAVRAGQDNGDGWSHSDGDYGQLARNSFVMYEIVFPDYTRARDARVWIDNSGAPYVGPLFWKGGDKFYTSPFPLPPKAATPSPATPTPTPRPATAAPTQPTATPRPATATPKPPTATPKPPTATPRPSTMPPTPTPSSPLATAYVGCFPDYSAKDLSFAAPIIAGGYTNQKCRYQCAMRNFNYSGTHIGSDWGINCACGNVYGSQGTTREEDCKYFCPGDASQKCGGDSINSVYKAGDAGYLGCFADDSTSSSTRDLSFQGLSSYSLTPDTCRKICTTLGYKYAGVQYGIECFCGNSYGRYGRLATSDCNSPCQGDQTVFCGGGNRNSIYTASPPAGYDY